MGLKWVNFRIIKNISQKMLLKFAGMFLANIFYYSEIVFEIKKRNARPLHFRILINKIYDIYFKIHCCLTNLELRHGVNKLIIFF